MHKNNPAHAPMPTRRHAMATAAALAASLALPAARAQGTAAWPTRPLRLGRNVGLRLLGERLMDNGWLYSGPPHPIT